MEKSLQEYQQFIDALAGIGEGLEARHVREGSWFADWRKHRLLQDLTPQQREILVQIVVEARKSAIHRALVIMTEQQYRLTRDNVELAFEPYGTEYFFDYIARVDGAPWPDVDGTVE